MQPRRIAHGFSLLEVLISLLVISILVGLLIPCLIYARDSARTTLCAGNLRQISNGWQMYLSDWNRFPTYPENPEYKYGGAVFRSNDNGAVLASDRPINRYIGVEELGGEKLAGVFRCPADGGIFKNPRGGRPVRLPSVLAEDTCFQTFGSSYRANQLVLDARLAEIDPSESRPLRASEVVVPTNRLILAGDPEWYYATRDPADPDYVLDATWHTVPAAGNIMTMDGSVRFVQLEPASIQRGGAYTLHPRR